MKHKHSTRNTDRIINRRKFVTGLATTSVIALSGCLSDPLHYTASPARISPETVSQSTYSLQNATKISVQEIINQFTEKDFSDRFTADSYILSYGQKDLPQTIAILSTPSVSLAGVELNPIAKADTKTILNLAISQMRGNSDLSVKKIEKKEERSINTSLGERTLEVFDITMNSSDFGEVTFDFFVIKHLQQDSVLFTGSIVLREIKGLPTSYDGYDPQKKQALRLLTDIDYPVDWETIKRDVESSNNSTDSN